MNRMTVKEGAVVVATCYGVEVNRHEMSVIHHAGKNNGTTEVIKLEHPTIQSLLRKGIFRECKLRAGPLGVHVSEPGITLTEFGKRVFAEHPPEEKPT